MPDGGGARRGGQPDVVLRAAGARLAVAGVPSARVDAELLAAHVLGCSRGEVAAAALRGLALDAGQAARLSALVAARERRVPLQHLVGAAPFRGLELQVGPGVFVPRPETEVTAGVAVEAARAAVAATGGALVVDLCTGSGAIALAVAHEVPAAQVHAVELDGAAMAWAARNAAGSGVHLVLADAATALPELDGTVDVVVSNPPYVPAGAVPREVEVRDHDPALALYGGGADGLDVPRAVLARAAALLRAGGLVVVEHAEVQQEALLALLSGPTWTAARGHDDLTGRPRCVSAVRGGRVRGGGARG